MKNNKIVVILTILITVAVCAPSWGQDLMNPMADGQKRECLDCHRRPNVDTNEGAFSNQALCFECHAKDACVRKVDDVELSLKVPAESFGQGGHRYVACIKCHTDVARSPHKTEVGAQCLECHPVHGGGKEPHLKVDCQACHRNSEFVTMDPETSRIRLAHVDDKGKPLTLVDHKLPDPEDPALCLRCHIPDNKVGASAAVLPEKSVLCIVCHDAPLRLGNWIFWLAGLIFVFGVFLQIQLFFRGKVGDEEESTQRKMSIGAEGVWQTVFSREFWSVLKVIILDVFLQRRLLKESVKRWFIHSLIYLSMMARLGLALLALITYGIDPDGSWAMTLINKNAPFTAFMYDLLGLFILIGIAWAAWQRFVAKPRHTVAEIQDTTAVVLIGLLVLFGFIAEGARILMTQIPADVAVYSFVGYFVSKVLSVFGGDWTGGYVYLWYIHALLGAALIAWLPFSKLRHMFVSPISLIMNRKLS